VFEEDLKLMAYLQILEFALRYEVQSLKIAALERFERQLKVHKPDMRFLNGLLTMSKDFKVKDGYNVGEEITQLVMKHVVSRFFGMIAPISIESKELNVGMAAHLAPLPMSFPHITSPEPAEAPESVVDLHPVLAFQKTFGFFDGSLDTTVLAALNATGLGCGLVFHRQCINCHTPAFHQSPNAVVCTECPGNNPLGLICIKAADEQKWKTSVERRVGKQREFNWKEKQKHAKREKQRKVLGIMAAKELEATEKENGVYEEETSQYDCLCGLPNEGSQVSCSSDEVSLIFRSTVHINFV
jgi:hypothetical protein